MKDARSKALMKKLKVEDRSEPKGKFTGWTSKEIKNAVEHRVSPVGKKEFKTYKDAQYDKRNSFQ